MFENFAKKITSTGVFAHVPPENRDGVLLYIDRIIDPSELNDPTSMTAEINGFRFPVDRLKRSEVPTEFVDSPAFQNRGQEILLTDQGRVLCENQRFIFHNDPVPFFGGPNPMFVRHGCRDLQTVSEVVQSYYFGSPLELDNEWTVPVNYFPHWNADRIKAAVESCPTLGWKSWVALEAGSDKPFREFRSRTNKNRRLMIGEEGVEVYILDETADEWLAWSKKNGLHFH